MPATRLRLPRSQGLDSQAPIGTTIPPNGLYSCPATVVFPGECKFILRTDSSPTTFSTLGDMLGVCVARYML